MTERNADELAEERLGDAELSLQQQVAARKARLSPAQSKQFEKQIRGTEDARVLAGIRRQPAGDTRPLSFSQERRWFLQQLDPADRLHIRPVAVRLTGKLNVALLEQSLTEITKRHEVLRATFDSIEGSPQQRIAPVRPIKLRMEDCCDLPATDRDSRTRAILNEGTRELFNLSTGPILRGILLRWGMEEHILLLVTHHIVFDAWSSEILVDELFTLYGQIVRGEEPHLQPLPISYADYARWQRQRFKAGTFDTSLAYWIDTFRDLPGRVELPLDRHRPKMQASDGACERFHLRRELVANLESLARRERTTLFSVLLAAFAVLMQRYTGAEDLLIGVPVAGRAEIETEGLVGPFVNTLVLRCDLSGDPRGRELVGLIRETLLNALEHQDVPFEKVVEAVHPERKLGRTPLFDVMFNLENVPRRSASSLELMIEEYDLDVSAVGTDLVAEIRRDVEGAWMCEFAYRSDLFDRETIQRALVHYELLLSGIAEDADRPISALPMLPATERQRLLVDWNATQREFPQDKCIHELIAAQVPEAKAVACGDQEISYAELNRQSDQVAGYLRDLGAGRDNPIGVMMHRNIDLIVALVGILKAGAAYLSLEPQNPMKRLLHMIEDADVRLIITVQDLESRLLDTDAHLVRMDSDWQTIAAASGQCPSSTEADPEDLAYVMYTSGSTGRPKGVMVSHRNVLGSLGTYRKLIGPGAGEARIGTNVTSYAFDVSVDEIFSPLCFGGEVHVVPYETSLDGRCFARYIVDNGINTAWIMPDLLSDVADAFEALGSLGNLRCLITGLSPKKQRLLQRFRDLSPSLKIFNGYGPTETTVRVSAHEYKTATDLEKDVPIGKVLPNHQIYIVDQNLQPVPIGVRGEILIGGVGVSRGYLNRPDLTLERFIPNPFATDAKDRVYRTGDLGRYMDDGTIEFLGRSDSQVKIRGHRIELREIELAVESHPQVTACYATTCTLAEDDVRLAAYLAWAGDRPGDESALRKHLQHQLPGFMLPSTFVFLTGLPLLPTGKIDRRALPQPEWGNAWSADRYLPPTSETEVKLVQIWQEVLKLDRVGITDNFFELGGHSLLAIRLVNRIKEALNVRVPIRTLFDSPTIAAVASFIDSAATEHESV